MKVRHQKKNRTEPNNVKPSFLSVSVETRNLPLCSSLLFFFSMSSFFVVVFYLLVFFLGLLFALFAFFSGVSSSPSALGSFSFSLFLTLFHSL